MAKIILEFNEDEEESALMAINGYKYNLILCDLDHEMRNVTKYGSTTRGINDESAQAVRDLIIELADNHDIKIIR